ncbi:hypothetical protein AZ78_2954 [Lysobacter capsici AZ78]|uniref:Uncharacterized protein n=1 Tax=Lysobacter capsici AZ78 TaxID=1444315 RepID=A0A108UA84_9GAMM|nr:hypothetical protein AZ78_2954 [Lysobacter capsici AZ78]
MTGRVAAAGRVQFFAGAGEAGWAGCAPGRPPRSGLAWTACCSRWGR